MTTANDTLGSARAGEVLERLPMKWRQTFWVVFGVQAALGPTLTAGFGLPSVLGWLDEIALTGLVLLVAFRAISTGRLPRLTLKAVSILAAYTTVVIVSAVVNRAPLVEALLGWRSLAQFFLFYAVLVATGFDGDDLRSFFGGFLCAAFVQAPFAIRQLMAIRGDLKPDDITGGFGPGTANLLGYFCAFVLLICFCRILVGRQRRYWLVAFPLGFVWPLTSANGSYLLFAMAWLGALVVSRDWRRWQSVLMVSLFVAVELGLVAYVTTIEYHVPVAEQLSSPVRNLVKYRIDNLGNPGRLVLTRDTIVMLTGEWRTVLFGLGPGSVGTTVTGGRKPSNFPAFSKRTGAHFVSSSVIAYLAELGASGMVVILLGGAQILWWAWRARRVGATREEHAWLLAVLLVVSFVTVAGGGDMTWIFQPLMYPVCALAAYATVLFFERQDDVAAASTADLPRSCAAG